MSELINLNDLIRKTPKKRKPQFSNQIRPISNFFEHFKCEYCFDYFDIPVVECKGKHLICKSCTTKFQNLRNCPLCGLNITETSSRPSIERQMQDLEFDCKWKSNGCNLKLPLSLYRSHIRTCKFSICNIQCYFAVFHTDMDCNWMGRENEIVNHMVREHHYDIFKLSSINEPFVVSYYLPSIKIARSSQKLLKIKGLENKKPFFMILEFFYESEREKAIFMIRSDNPTNSFNFDFSLLDTENQPISTHFDLSTCSFLDKKSTEYPFIPQEHFCEFPFSKLDSLKFREGTHNKFTVQIKFNN